MRIIDQFRGYSGDGFFTLQSNDIHLPEERLAVFERVLKVIFGMKGDEGVVDYTQNEEGAES